MSSFAHASDFNVAIGWRDEPAHPVTYSSYYELHRVARFHGALWVSVWVKWLVSTHLSQLNSPPPLLLLFLSLSLSLPLSSSLSLFSCYWTHFSWSISTVQELIQLVTVTKALTLCVYVLCVCVYVCLCVCLTIATIVNPHQQEPTNIYTHQQPNILFSFSLSTIASGMLSTTSMIFKHLTTNPQPNIEYCDIA